MSRKFAITLFGLLLASAMSGSLRADSLTDPTRPPMPGERLQQPGELRLEGVVCHSGAFVAIANDRLIHVGDRVDGTVIRGITAAGVLYSHGSRKRFAYAPEPWIEGCTGAASAAQPAGGPLIGVDVAGAPAGAFFQGIVENTPYNVLVHPDVTGRITVSLKNVTLQQLLDAMRDLYGLDYRHTAAGYLILPAALQTRIFHISYLDLRRYGVSNTLISSGQVTQGNFNTQYGGTQSTPPQSPTTATVGHGDDKTTIDTTGTSVMTRDDSDFWGNLEANLHALIGTGPGRKVIIDPQSGIVVVRALPEQLAEVRDYLRTTEATVTRQVLLEAKIIEVDLNHAYQAGVNWAQIMTLGSSHYAIGQTAPANGFGIANALTPPSNSPITLSPGTPITSLATNSLGGAFTVAADFANFDTVIQLLSTEGNTHVLSSPRVATLDNQKAIIKAGTDQFYVTGVQSNTVVSTTTPTISNNVSLTPFFSGVALDVTPQIGTHGEVLLHIHPIVSQVNTQTLTIEVQGSPDVLPMAQSAVRESDSVVRAHSGQVIVIGGLMQEEVDKQQYKTPVLGDIPGVGRLFRSEQDTKSKVELVILLRAMVVNGSDWPSLVNEAPGMEDATAAKQAKSP
ncbi:MAG TPA: pilus (MSHA type) biogenesis protein MshL [Steroidobacteraceae bacterium]|nr:pilus (MSHA type) biogenesis protein MshL [Steroidobacteraceae bacterium]